MPEILSQAELLRLARNSAPSTRSSSPGPSSSYLMTSPAVQAGALSPPPPTHYLRNKSRTEETSETSLKLLRKRSEIYDRDRDRSRGSVVTRAPLSNTNAPDGLLFQQDLFRPGYLEPSYARERTRLPDGVGSLPNSCPSFSPSKQWAFLDTDPLSPPPTSVMKPPFARERDNLLLLRPTNSHSTDGDSPGDATQSLAPTELQAVNSVDSHSTPVAGSSRGSLRDREAGITGAPAQRLSLNRFRRGRSTGSDSSISISVSSHASSSFFSPSLEPSSNYSPPVQFPQFSQSVSSGFQIVSPAAPATPYEGEPYSPLSFAPPSSRSSPALFDVQKRRRAHAFDHFTSYTESLPYHSRSSSHSHHNQRERPSAEDKAGTVSKPVKGKSKHSRTNALHSMRSAPDFNDGSWRRRSLDTDMDMEDEHDKGRAEMTPQLDCPKRKLSSRITRSIKSMLTSKSAA